MCSLKAFIAYSHVDEEFKNKLQNFLKSLENERTIECWNDRRIESGTEWDSQIDENILSSQIILLLLSQDFISSDYCYNVEMKRALELHDQGKARVIPIVVRDCTWKETVLKRLQVLPQDSKPISNWDNPDSAYMNVYKGIKQSIAGFLSLQTKKPGFDIMETLRKETEETIDSSSELKLVSLSIIRSYMEQVYENSFYKWYDAWYAGHWQNEYPYTTIRGFLNKWYESTRGSIKNLRILDCACGTGNTFVAFSRAGMNIYGTDGSQNMLLRAKQNCESCGVPIKNLVLSPISWTDDKKYFLQFEENSFDIIINTANSFCHLPPTKEYMEHALSIFLKLLKPGGRLLIDTKKYIRSHVVKGIPFYKELRYDADIEEWIERDERKETVDLSDYGRVNFHTRMMYDIDPSFSQKIQRAMIVVSVYGETIAPETFVIPYYPLPAKVLQSKMKNVGYRATSYSGFEDELIQWKYDIVVGQKEK